MRVLVLCSSGNAVGFTHNMCVLFDRYAREKGHESEIVNLHKLKIKDCTGCVECRDGGKCVIKDDAEKLFRKMERADILVMATPIRFNGPSSVLKRFIDRLNPYWYSSRKHPVNACGMICAGSPRPNFEHARSEMIAACNTVGMRWLGDLCVPETDFRTMTDGRIEKFAEKILRLSGD